MSGCQSSRPQIRVEVGPSASRTSLADVQAALASPYKDGSWKFWIIFFGIDIVLLLIWGLSYCFNFCFWGSSPETEVISLRSTSNA